MYIKPTLLILCLHIDWKKGNNLILFFRLFFLVSCMRYQVQRHLQMRIDAQGKYMQTILEKACQTLTGKNGDCQSYHGVGNQGYTEVGSMKDFSSSVNFPCLEDLHIYGERPNPYDSSKAPIIWSNDMQLLQEVGTAAACIPSQEDAFKRWSASMTLLKIDSATTMNSYVKKVYELVSFLQLLKAASWRRKLRLWWSLSNQHNKGNPLQQTEVAILNHWEYATIRSVIIYIDLCMCQMKYHKYKNTCTRAPFK